MNTTDYKSLFDLEYYKVEAICPNTTHVRFFRQLENAEKASKSAAITKRAVVNIFDKNNKIVRTFDHTEFRKIS